MRKGYCSNWRTNKDLNKKYGEFLKHARRCNRCREARANADHKWMMRLIDEVQKPHTRA